MRDGRRSTGTRPEAVRTCRDVIALLGEYMEGALAPALTRRLEEHLDDCPACESFLETLKATRAAVRNLRCDDIPEDCHARLRSFLDRKLKSGRARSVLEPRRRLSQRSRQEDKTWRSHRDRGF